LDEAFFFEVDLPCWSLRMRQAWTPSIVPDGSDQTVYLVLDDFGDLGRVWRETDVNQADLETVLADLMTGEYHDPVLVAAFNTAEHWAADVSADVAQEIRRRADLAGEDVSSSIVDFVDRHAGWERQLTLRLA
jgi:hypothetical protein